MLVEEKKGKYMLKQPHKCSNECNRLATTIVYDENKRIYLCKECVAMELENAVIKARREKKGEKK